MRVVVAPDKFKGTLSAGRAAVAMAKGAVRAGEELGVEVEIDACPVSDGGEGFVGAIVRSGRVRERLSRARDATGERVGAVWAVRDPGGWRCVVNRLGEWLPAAGAAYGGVGASLVRGPAEWVLGRLVRGRVGYVEQAEASALARVDVWSRSPGVLSTAGVGELIIEAVRHRCGRVVVGLGGSATVDGGIGMATALGVEFLDVDGRRVRAVGGEMERVERVVVPRSVVKMLDGVDVVAACDVDNPLLGDEGAARVYGPQKGADAEEVERLEAGMANLARRCAEAGIEVDPGAAGMGAAGGLGFGLAAFCGARVERGAGVVLEAVGFRERVRGADLVLTGEGRLDRQSVRGKAPMEVSRVAAEEGVECIAVVGSEGEGVELTVDRERGGWLSGWVVADGEGDAERRVEDAAADAVREWVGRGGSGR